MKKISLNNESSNIKIGVILSLLSFVVSMVVNVFFIRFINRPDIAGQSQYGLYTFSASMTSMLLALSFGMNSSYIRFATIAKKENGEEGLKKINGSFALLFIVSSIIAAILGVLMILGFHFGLIGSNYEGPKRIIIVSCLSVSVINVVVSLISNIFTLYTNYNMRFIWARSLTITTSILTPLFTCIIIYFNHNIVTYVCVELAVNALALLVNMLFCIKSLNYKVKISLHKSDFHILKSIIVFTFFIFLVTVVTELTSSTPKVLLGLFPNSTGDSEITVAYYQLAATFIGSIAVASSAVSSTYIPLVNRHVAYGSNDDINRLFLKSTKSMIVAYALVMGGFIACGREFVVIWQGNYYGNTKLIYYLACALSLISFVPSTFGITSEVQRAKNKHHFRSLVLLIGFLVNFLVSLIILILLPNFVNPSDPNYYVYQVIACAIGFAIGNVVNAVAMSIYNQKVVKLDMFSYYKTVLFYLLIVGISFGFVYLAFMILPFNLNIIVAMIAKGVLFVVVFVSLVYLLDRRFIKGIFKKEEIQISAEKTFKANIDQIDINKKIFVFKDFYKALRQIDFSKKEYSIFDSPLMKELKDYHDSNGMKFVLLITKEISVRKLPKSICVEISENSEWLSVAFSSGKHYPYSFVDAPFITNDFGNFVNKFRKHNCRLERIVFPEFEAKETQIGYFKRYYDFRISGIAEFDILSGSKGVSVSNNLLLFSCAKAIDGEQNSSFYYFESTNLSVLNNFVSDNNPTIDDVLKDVFMDKKYPDFYGKRIAVINTYNGLSTGNLAKQIMKASKEVGLKTKLYYGRLRDDSDMQSNYFGASKFVNLINNVYVKLSGCIGHAHYFETKKLIRMLNDYNPDIIHLHNIAGNCLNYGLLFNYLKDKKVVVTMHDCFWLTGRCSHFTYSEKECEEWKNGCRKCRHLDFYMQTYLFDRASDLYKEKRRFINDCKHLKLICISNWQKSFFDISGIPENKVKLIYNGIESKPQKTIVYNQEVKKLIFVSSYLTKDKGIEEINKLAETLDESKYRIEVIGQLNKKTWLSNKIIYSGSLSNDEVLERVANSDLFVYPTHADTLPTVLIESLMVGTPIVSYDVGGCSDIIREFGKVVRYGDFGSLKSAIEDFDPSSFDREKISYETRKRFDVSIMNKEYIQLYDEALKDE